MSGGGFYRGTSQDQDARFSNKDKKLLNAMKWPEEFNKKVDLKKVYIITHLQFFICSLNFSRRLSKCCLLSNQITNIFFVARAYYIGLSLLFLFIGHRERITRHNKIALC